MSQKTLGPVAIPSYTNCVQKVRPFFLWGIFINSTVWFGCVVSREDRVQTRHSPVHNFQADIMAISGNYIPRIVVAEVFWILTILESINVLDLG